MGQWMGENCRMDREKEAKLAMNGSIYEPSGSVRRRRRILQGWNANWLDEFAVLRR